jgi:hypothetical protein
MKNIFIFIIGLCVGMILLAIAVSQKPNPKYQGVESWEVCGTFGCE